MAPNTHGLTYDMVSPFRRALAEAARTDDSNASRVVPRFIELRAGILETLLARRHHLVTGRRGTGKSTLLHVARDRLKAEGSPVAIIDMERYKGRHYPDVLIEILAALLEELRPPVRLNHPFRDLALRRRLRRAHKELAKLLHDPQSLAHSVRRSAIHGSEESIEGSIEEGSASARVGNGSVRLGGAVAGGRRRTSESSVTATAEFVELKIERLQGIAGEISDTLSELVKRTQSRRALIFIDDYYYVRLADQPSVLDYLHQVCKGTGVWLKIGGVGTRLLPFRDGDPPVGMQPAQDIDRLPIDITLEDFATAQGFLERMLAGVLADFDVSVSQLFTDVARSRMVLACGGAVARDYITLTSAAVDEAVEQLSKDGALSKDTLIKLNAEAVNRAASKRRNKKEEEELNLDAGSDASQLKQRWRDICDFIRATGTAFILVRQTDLDEEPWGAEIQQLENLRLLHRIRDTVPNTPNWRGVKTIIFMVDLGQVATQRLRRPSIPEFWQNSTQFDKLRRAEWIYLRDWRARKGSKASSQVSASTSGDEEDSE